MSGAHQYDWVEPMGPRVIAIAHERTMVQALLTRLRARKLEEAFLAWPTDQPGIWPAGITATCAVAALPMLAGREIVALLDLLDGSPALAVAVVAARVTDEPDTIGLFATLAARSLVVDLRGNVALERARTGPNRDLSQTLWDPVIDLVTSRAHGRWEMTDDGMLVAASPRQRINTARFARSRPRSGDDALPGRSPLDGDGRIR